MNAERFTPLQERLLLLLAVPALFGLFVPNGIFLYESAVKSDPSQQALGNPIALVFITEVFLLMFLFAWLICHWEMKFRRPITFRLMSLLGSMVFCIHAMIYAISRQAAKRTTAHPKDDT
jgi:hypothetical protein